jgi:hypothetical protein
MRKEKPKQALNPANIIPATLFTHLIIARDKRPRIVLISNRFNFNCTLTSNDWSVIT